MRAWTGHMDPVGVASRHWLFPLALRQGDANDANLGLEEPPEPTYDIQNLEWTGALMVGLVVVAVLAVVAAMCFAQTWTKTDQAPAAGQQSTTVRVQIQVDKGHVYATCGGRLRPLEVVLAESLGNVTTTTATAAGADWLGPPSLAADCHLITATLRDYARGRGLHLSLSAEADGWVTVEAAAARVYHDLDP
mmetsp:Transcript_9052/g.21619  ORF Transcript_9052/g.21619 Transcript_9052/m.21619 type:complete len:192 (-) Transcript_9052:65-640(-)